MGVFDGLIGGVAGGALDIAGGLMDAAQSRQNQRHADDMTRFYAENAVQLRAKDARLAGISPLVAMGMMPMSPPPAVISSDMGQAMGHAGQSLAPAISRAMDPFVKEEHQLNLKLLESQISETDARAGYYRSQATGGAPGTPSGLGVQLEGGSNTGVPGQSGNPEQFGPYIDIKPVEQQSHKLAPYEGVVAGTHAAGQLHRLPSGLPFFGPNLQGESLSEIISEMSTAELAGWVLHNQNIFGGDYISDYYAQRFLGKSVDPKKYPIPGGSYSPGRDPLGSAGRKFLDEAKRQARPYIKGYKNLKKSFEERVK